MSSKSRLWAGAQVQCTPQESGAGGPWSLAGAPVSVSHCALEDILLCTRMMLRAHTHENFAACLMCSLDNTPCVFTHQPTTKPDMPT